MPTTSFVYSASFCACNALATTKMVAIVVFIPSNRRSFYVLRWNGASVMVVVCKQFNVRGGGRRVEKKAIKIGKEIESPLR